MKMEMLRNRLSYHGKSRHLSKQSRRLGAALGSADLITALLIKRLSCGQILASLWLQPPAFSDHFHPIFRLCPQHVGKAKAKTVADRLSRN